MTRQITLDGVKVHYPRYYYPPKILRSSYGWFYWRSVRGVVQQLLDEQQPDVVLAYWAHPDGAAAVRAARLALVPSAVMVGGSDVLCITRDPVRRRRVIAVLEATDAVLCVSEHLRAKVLEFGISERKVHVFRQGVDTQIFHPGDQADARRRLGLPCSDKVVVWVGRMVEVKGLDVLLDAMAIAHKRGTSPRLFLVGDGPLRQSLTARAKALGLPSRVSFVGSMSSKALADWYRAADACALRVPRPATAGLDRVMTWEESAASLIRILEPLCSPSAYGARRPIPEYAEAWATARDLKTAG